MSIIYKRNFVDLALIVAFSMSTVIITEYFNILQQQDDLKLPVILASGPVHMNYPGVMIAPGQALPRVHMMICCPGTTLPRGKFIVI